MEQFSGNYTGPYWSDGKFQTSVEFGSTDPQSELDKLSRLHDSAYARYVDRNHREAADEIYARDAKVLAGKFPELAGNIVQYGNYASRQAKQLASDVGYGFNLPGALKFAATNVYNANKMLNGTYLSKEKRDIEEYYNTDPRKGQTAVTYVKPFKDKTPFEQAQDAARAEKLAAAAARGVSQKLPNAGAKAILEKAKAAAAKVKTIFGQLSKKNTVVPETPEQRNKRLIQAQKENFERYHNTYMRAQLVPTKRRKYKKKKYNVQKAIRVLPAHCIH